MHPEQNSSKAIELVAAIQFFSQKGWSPATSTNYSIKLSESEILISKSGVDKAYFTNKDLIVIDREGKIRSDYQRDGIKSSAETEIHTYLYHHLPEAQCVLHTHSKLGTVLSHLSQSKGHMTFEGLEILKGLEGNTTHHVQELLPVVYNSQIMTEINLQVEPWLKRGVHGFLIAGHGLYTWGKDVASAKRQIETFEFLLECYDYTR